MRHEIRSVQPIHRYDATVSAVGLLAIDGSFVSNMATDEDRTAAKVLNLGSARATALGPSASRWCRPERPTE